jgi:hypothetical protein
VAKRAQTGDRRSHGVLHGRRLLASACCIPLAAAALGIAAMHGGGNGIAKAAATRVSAPACASVRKEPISPPPEISAAVLPPETLITSVRHPHPGMTLVNGVVAAPFRSVVEFYVTKLPAAGYVNTLGDAEMGEAESFFVGAAVRGKWKVNGMPFCADAVKLAVYVRR